MRIAVLAKSWKQFQEFTGTLHRDDRNIFQYANAPYQWTGKRFDGVVMLESWEETYSKAEQEKLLVSVFESVGPVE